MRTQRADIRRPSSPVVLGPANDAYTKLLMHPLSGESTPIDRSVGGGGRTLTKVGSPSVISSPQSPTGGCWWGMSAGNVITAAASDDWNFGTSPFWLELYVYATTDFTSNHACAISCSATDNKGWGIYFLNPTELVAWFCNGETSLCTNTNIFHRDICGRAVHLAAGRDVDDYVRVFLDGKVVMTHRINAVSQINGSSGTVLGIGRYAGYTGMDFPGYVSEVIIEKGRCRHTADFTPRTFPHGPDAR